MHIDPARVPAVDRHHQTLLFGRKAQACDQHVMLLVGCREKSAGNEVLALARLERPRAQVRLAVAQGSETAARKNAHGILRAGRIECRLPDFLDDGPRAARIGRLDFAHCSFAFSDCACLAYTSACNNPGGNGAASAAVLSSSSKRVTASMACPIRCSLTAP